MRQGNRRLFILCMTLRGESKDMFPYCIYSVQVVYFRGQEIFGVL